MFQVARRTRASTLKTGVIFDDEGFTLFFVSGPLSLPMSLLAAQPARTVFDDFFKVDLISFRTTRAGTRRRRG